MTGRFVSKLKTHRLHDFVLYVPPVKDKPKVLYSPGTVATTGKTELSPRAVERSHKSSQQRVHMHNMAVGRASTQSTESR